MPVWGPCDETLGLHREGDPDGAPRVASPRGLLDLPEALGTDYDGKATVIVDHLDPSPDHPRPARRTEKAIRDIRSARDPSALSFFAILR